jgi:hypothetical protein
MMKKPVMGNKKASAPMLRTFLTSLLKRRHPVSPAKGSCLALRDSQRRDWWKVTYLETRKDSRGYYYPNAKLPDSRRSRCE